MNSGHHFKKSFNGMLQRAGGRVFLHKRYGEISQVTSEYQAMKNGKQNAPNKIMFQFSDKIEVESGDIIQQDGASDLWEVYETEDQVIGGIYIYLNAFVHKLNGSIGRRKEILPSVHIGGDNLGGIQIGTKRSSQAVSITVSSFHSELESLRDIVVDATDLDELDKEEVQLALDRIEELSKREEKAPSLLKRMKEKLDFVKTSLDVSEKAAAAAPYIAAMIERL